MRRYPAFTCVCSVVLFAGGFTAGRAQDIGIEETFTVPAPAVETKTPVPETSEKVVDPSFGPLPAFPVPKGGDISERGLLWRMNHYMAGQRVISIGYGEFRDDITWSDDAFKRETSVIGKLQMVCEKQSAKDKDLIPFKVGGSYVVASQTREEANTDLSRLSEFDLASRGLLLSQVLLAIPGNQLASLGSENGIAFRSLPADVQPAVIRALRPPLKIVGQKSGSSAGSDGLPERTVENEDKGRLDDPIDWSSARIRARLDVTYVSLRDGLNGYGSMGKDDGLHFDTTTDQFSMNMNDGVDIPVYSEVPNTYKPSDLTGKMFTQPLNAAGIHSVEEIVKRLEKSTGLTMSVWKPYRPLPVFIGSNSVTAGEVIDGLRLALTGAWRKLGSTYILAFDKRGLQAIQLLARESAAEGAKAVKKRRREVDRSTDWVRIADELPFDRSDPLRLTDEQRAKLFSAGDDNQDGPAPRQSDDIPFGEMTPEQQAWVRAEAGRNTIYLPESEGKPSGRRPYTEEDIRNCSLQGMVNLDISISVPGYGWVRVPSNWNVQDLSPYSIRNARKKLSGKGKPRNLLDEAPPEVKKMIMQPEPFVLPAPTKGIMTPPLGQARLTVLADEMKRHGLNTLFYPVLIDGYSTFESKVFALHPSLRGADGWAAAVAAMKPAGIKVVGYFRTLAWRGAGMKPHYLSKHPDWLDVDVVGRSRGEWFETHPEDTVKTVALGGYTGDFVRPAEPMVSYRLQTLLSEFASKPGSIGVCFTDCWPDIAGAAMIPLGSTRVPRLGFGVSDRVQSLKDTGTDPVDRITDWDDYLPPFLEGERWTTVDRSALGGSRSARLLVNDLITRARSARKDWKVWLDGNPAFADNDGKSEFANAPKPDETFGSLFGSLIMGEGKSGMLLPITSGNFITTLAEEELADEGEVPQELLKMPSIVTYGMFFGMREAGEAFNNLPSVILDYRTSPEEISSSLKWIKLPDKAPAAAKPKPQPKPAVRVPQNR